jgi:hypothetical protein
MLLWYKSTPYNKTRLKSKFEPLKRSLNYNKYQKSRRGGFLFIRFGIFSLFPIDDIVYMWAFLLLFAAFHGSRRLFPLMYRYNQGILYTIPEKRRHIQNHLRIQLKMI